MKQDIESISNNKIIGIPRAISYYNNYPFYYGFFKGLGFDILLSDKTTTKLINDGSNYVVSDTCLPIKVFVGHVVNLLSKGCDTIFIPSLQSTAYKVNNCTKIRGLPEIIRNIINKPFKMIEPTLDKTNNISFKDFCYVTAHTEMIKNVRVSGFVKHPRTYKFVDGKRLVDIINESGGLTKDADLRGIVFIRKNLQMKQVDLAKKNNEKDIKLLEGRIAGGFKQASDDIQAKVDMINMLKLDQLNLSNKYSGQIALDIKSNDLTKIKDSDNLEIQDGDEIYIPRMSKHVSVIGEVYNEQAFAFRKGMTAGDYIKEVGGYTPNASKFRLYKVGVNGRAEKIKPHTKIVAGDTIVVPRKIAGNDWITPVCEALKGIASILTTAFVVTKI